MAVPLGKAVILGGRHGLLGQALTEALAASGAETLPLGRTELQTRGIDLTNPSQVARFLDAEEPDILFNAVGYTNVDQAEDEPEAAYILNRDLPAALGRASSGRATLLVHYSTDFVFSGPRDTPWTEADEPCPASVYGLSKLAGEQALLERYAGAVVVIRTAWLFGLHKTNFVHKILTLAREREAIGVVADQFGSPTSTRDLAHLSLALVRSGGRGLFHLVNAGRASWRDLAAEAVDAAGLSCRVDPIPTEAYPTKAVRPAYSVLDTSRFTRATGLTPPPWRESLRQYARQCLIPDTAG